MSKKCSSLFNEPDPDQINFTRTDLCDYPELWEHLHQLEDELADWQARNQLMEQEARSFEELDRPRFPYMPHMLMLTFFMAGMALGLSLH